MIKEKLNNFYVNHHNWSLLIIAIILAFLTGIFSDQVTSFIYPNATGNTYVNDPNMFYYMGKLLKNGYEPYYGFFDHKGPYIFYFTALAHILGGRFGMLLLHTIVFGIFYYFLFKIYDEYKINGVIRIITTLLLFSIINICGQNPSDSELLFPFIIASIYFYIKAINGSDDKYYLYGNIFAGLSTGIAIHLRLTEAMVPFALVVYFGVRQLINKKYKNILINAGVCVLSIIITSLPPLIHSLESGFTGIMYESILFNNFTYTKEAFEYFDIFKISSILILLVIAIFILISLIMLKKKNKISNDEILFYGITFSVMLVLQIIIAYYIHYMLIIFPLLFIFVARILSFINFNKYAKIISLSAITLVTIISSIIFPIINYSSQIDVDNSINEYISDVIEESDKDKVLCYQSSASIYINNNIMVGYPDFCCQENHMAFSKYYTLDNIIDYAKKDVKYVIFDSSLSDNDGFIDFVKNSGNFIKINTNHTGSKYISIYQKL